MVIQYKPKSGKNPRWKDYKGKKNFKGSVRNYKWRLLNHDKKKILVKPTNYSKVMKRFKQIEYFKHKK